MRPPTAAQSRSAVRAAPVEERVSDRAEAQGPHLAGDRDRAAALDRIPAEDRGPDRVPDQGVELGPDRGVELGGDPVLGPPVASGDGVGTAVGVAGGGGGVGRAPIGASYEETRAVASGGEQREEVERHVSAG